MLGNRSVLRHVIDSCAKASIYINNWGTKKIFVDYALCIPYEDPIKRKLGSEVPIVEGPEEDVLLRYLMLLEKTKSDYIVRITADCPLIPSFVISKCITTAVMNEYDYLSNVEERCRTSADGMDCEVISKNLLIHAGKHATLPEDREHVTTFIRKNTSHDFKYGTVINFMDLSHIKLSLDTKEDLERIRSEYDRVQGACDKAQQIFGRQNVHRL